MGFVARGIDQGHRAAPAELAQLAQRPGILRDLVAIALAELRPALRVVTEPAPQGRARRDVLEPDIDGGLLLREPARPQPLHQHALAVAALPRQINPLDLARWPGGTGHVAKLLNGRGSILGRSRHIREPPAAAARAAPVNGRAAALP